MGLAALRCGDNIRRNRMVVPCDSPSPLPGLALLGHQQETTAMPVTRRTSRREGDLCSTIAATPKKNVSLSWIKWMSGPVNPGLSALAPVQHEFVPEHTANNLRGMYPVRSTEFFVGQEPQLTLLLSRWPMVIATMQVRGPPIEQISW